MNYFELLGKGTKPAATKVCFFCCKESGAQMSTVYGKVWMCVEVHEIMHRRKLIELQNIDLRTQSWFYITIPAPRRSV